MAFILKSTFSVLRRILIIIVSILLLGYGISILIKEDNRELLYVQEIVIEDDQYIEDFKSIHAQVKDNYSLYEDKCIDLDSLYSVYESRIMLEVKSNEDYANVLFEYFASLKAGHANAMFECYSASYWPSYIENRLFVDKPNTYLQKAGFLDKDEIIAIDETPINKWIEDKSNKQSGSTESYKMLMSANAAFVSYIEQQRTYTIVRGVDTIDINLELPGKGFYPDADTETPYMFYCKYDSIGYIYLKTMQGMAIELFDSAYAKLNNLPHLIIDIRDNGGGSSEVGRNIAEKLIRKNQKHCLNNVMMKPTPNAYKGKVYLLTSGYTFSAAESFVIDMRESKNAMIIGEPTAGDTGNGPQNFQSKYGVQFRLPTRSPRKSHSGFPLEGVGVPPHHHVIQTIDDFIKDKDTVLDFVLQKIQQG